MKNFNIINKIMDSIILKEKSLFQVVHRVYSFLEELENKYPDKNILVVCHGGIVRVIHSYFHDMTNEELMTWLPENCCIQSYEK